MFVLSNEQQQQQYYVQQHQQAWMMMQQRQLQYQQYQQQQYQQVRSQPDSSVADEIRTLWIGDLQYWMDENYIFTCFAPIGEVVFVKLIRNKQTGQLEGYGFIDFMTRAGAEQALQTYNGIPMPSADQNFRLNWASLRSGEKRGDDTPDYTIFVGDLAPDVTDYILQDTFKPHYTSIKGAKVVIDRLTGRPRGYGFVRFGDEAEQQRAMTEMNGKYCSSRPMRIGVATNNKQATNAQQQQQHPKGLITEVSNEFHFKPRAVTSFSRMKPETKKPDEIIEMNLCNEICIKLMLTNMEEIESSQGNIVSSPLSINILLSMLANGYGEGSTGRIKLMNALGFTTIDEVNRVSTNLMKLITSDSDGESSSENLDYNKRGYHPPRMFDLMYGHKPSYGKPCVSMANGVWTDHARPLKAQFVEIATQVYQSCTETLDFSDKNAVVKKVNSWAEKNTKGLIKDLISQDSVPDNGAILANALYFKAAWANKFSEYTTKEEKFDLLDGTIVNVPFMKSTEYQYYRSLDGFKLLRLPYRPAFDETRNTFSMYIFLPELKDGLKPLLERFKQDPSLVHTKCDSAVDCITWIPKFTITFDFEPSDIMKTMGLDLSMLGMLTNMIDYEGAEGSVSKVIQKSYIEVNEKGTKAAAVTCAFVCGSSMGSPPRPPPVMFVADHPFFFMIKDDVSGAVLFSGIVVNPSLLS